MCPGVGLRTAPDALLNREEHKLLKKQVLVSLAASAVIATAIVGCGKGSTSSSIAEINGQKISNQQFVDAVSRTPQAGQVLAQLMEQQMILGMAKDQNVSPTDEQVNKKIDFIRKTQDLDQMMKDNNVTLQDVKDQQKITQAKINLAAKAFKDKVTDAEVNDLYSKRKDAFSIPERVKTEIAIFPTKEAADKASKELQGGADFEKVTKDAGGQFQHADIPKSAPQPQFQILAKAAFDTPKGKYSQPISFGGMGMLILKPGDKVPAVTIPENDAKSLIKDQLLMQKADSDTDYAKKMEEARKTAKITISVPSLKNAEKDFRNPQPTMPMMMGGPGGPGGPRR